MSSRLQLLQVPQKPSFQPNRRILLHSKYKVEIITLGKRTSKDAVYDDAIAEYVRRMRGTVSFSERHLKRDLALRSLSVTHDSGASLILLDAQGFLPNDSHDFSRRVFTALQNGRCHLTFVIGDAEGFPNEVRALTGSRVQALSLSTLTLTHKMVSFANHAPFLYLHVYVKFIL